MKEIRTLIIGFGSIGQRHAYVLGKLGSKVAILSQREQSKFKQYKNIEDALCNYSPNYIIISNENNKHYGSLKEIINQGYKYKLLIEKPIFEKLYQIPKNNIEFIGVAYNLRYNPIIQKIREIGNSQEIISINIYVGQYLPNWRPSVDYRKTYSSSKEKGGGVILDLSHEIDYLIWIFGNLDNWHCLSGKYSKLEIDSEDEFCLIGSLEKCPIMTMQLNYNDFIGKRQVIINTTKDTYICDLLNSTIKNKKTTENYNLDRNYTYKEMHKNILNGRYNMVCSTSEALNILNLINKFNESAS